MTTSKLRLIGITLFAALIAAGCASTGDLKAVAKRVGAVETAAAAEAAKTVIALNQLGTRVTANAATTDAALKSVAAKLQALDAANTTSGAKLQALGTASTVHGAKLATVETTVTTQGVKLATVETTVTAQSKDLAAQQKVSAQLTAMLRAHRRGDKIESSGVRVALGDKAPSGVVECWGFASGKANLGELLARNPSCKAKMEVLVKEVKEGKAEVLGVVGYEDKVACKAPVTDECRAVARSRAVSVLVYLGADAKLASTEAPTDDIGASPAENRGVLVFWKKK